MKFILTTKFSFKLSLAVIISICLLSIIAFSGCSNKKNKFIIDETTCKNPTDYVEVAQKYYERKDYKKSIVVYKALISKYQAQKDIYEKSLAWAYYEVGFCYHLLHKKKDALDYFKIVIKDFSIIGPKTLAEQRVLEITK
jgi:tetratricopeptide (TPR) repeat protein